jgi:hypothetical protein
VSVHAALTCVCRFHPQCVGLGDEDLSSVQYRCMHCCVTSAVAYPGNAAAAASAASGLYCVCRRGELDDVDMVACDCCGQWCVALQATPCVPLCRITATTV